MKRLALLALLALLAGCAPGQKVPGAGGAASTVNFVHDEEHGVSCWLYTAGSGISCLPDSALR